VKLDVGGGADWVALVVACVLTGAAVAVEELEVVVFFLWCFFLCLTGSVVVVREATFVFEVVFASVLYVVLVVEAPDPPQPATTTTAAKAAAVVVSARLIALLPCS
jgi:hypothetical protein